MSLVIPRSDQRERYFLFEAKRILNNVVVGVARYAWNENSMKTLRQLAKKAGVKGVSRMDRDSLTTILTALIHFEY
jgi:hypothetical protein